MKTNMMKACGMAVLLATAGCNLSPPADAVPELTFDQVQKVQLAVNKIDIIDNYQSPLKAPYAEQKFKQTPEEAVTLLVQKQLKAAGGANALRVVLEDASVIEENLPQPRDAAAIFAREAPKIYRAKISLRFEMYDEAAPDIVLGNANVTVTRNKSVMGDISLAERDQAFFDLNEALMKDVSSGLQTTVKETFGLK